MVIILQMFLGSSVIYDRGVFIRLATGVRLGSVHSVQRNISYGMPVNEVTLVRAKLVKRQKLLVQTSKF